jgi:hypothetical protein
VLAEVFFQQGDEPFICAVRGRICVEQLEAAQHDFRENLPDVLEQGDGIYTFDFFYEKGEYDEWGRCEIAPGWGFDFVSFAAFEGGDEEDPTPAADESQIDDIPDFTPGSGNKAKRRIAALAAKAKPESFPCWSCRKPVTMEQRADADGNCPHCAAELDLEDWPNAKTGCAYEVGDWACREGGYLWYAGDGEGWDPEDCTHICPHCRTKDYLEEAKENAESCSSYSNNGSSGTGLDIWASAEKTALTANHPAACKALAEIGPVSALDGDDVVICNTQRVGRDQTAKGGDDE